jgi:hypothetical protein
MARRPTLPEPQIVGQWWKNRAGQAVRVSLSTFEGRNLVDIRSWYTGADGTMKPGKGFACSVRHLERLVDALARARLKAKELGLVDDEHDMAPDPDGGAG